ncbi:MAG: FG-GAP repeat protein [Alphaproteobacteria bacterium]|nr:FG-GAP repeat protein [Alphaproteobacteria bacterium]
MLAPLLVAAIGCALPLLQDQDNDGFGVLVDCDDADAERHPFANDVAQDGVDQNCDGVDGTDADGDGQASMETGGEDCDDADVDVFSEAPEICGDGVVNDCDSDAGRALAICGLSGGRSVTEADARMLGRVDHSNAGSAASAVGDMDGDGLPDLLIGAPVDGGEGVVWVISGMARGDLTLGTDTIGSIRGLSGNSRAGFAVSGVGDMNGDGWDDVLIGSPFQDTQGEDDGAAHLVLGPVSGDLSLTADAHATLVGESVSDLAGYAVASAGDIDGDGQPDVLVTSPGDDQGGDSAGATYLLPGPLEGTLSLAVAFKLSGEEAGDQAGHAAAAVGDVDGDGVDDLLIGSYLAGSDDRGAAYLILGPVRNSFGLHDADAKLIGDQDDCGAGHSVAAAGDVNGDGLADILVGAPYMDRDRQWATGAAYLVFGPVGYGGRLASAQATLTSSREGSLAGWSVDSAGDVDGDGHGDLLVGALTDSRAGPEAGAVHLVRGPVIGHVELADADGRFTGAQAYGRLGKAVAGVGDVDGDGFDDVLLGAHASGEDHPFPGAAYLLLGGGL